MWMIKGNAAKMEHEVCIVAAESITGTGKFTNQPEMMKTSARWIVYPYVLGTGRKKTFP
jgi:hypothetical protein